MDNLLISLLVLMLFDFITGIGKSIIGKSEKSQKGYLNSSVMWRGGLKKILTLIIVAVATVLNILMIPETALIRNMTVTYYISVEALSVIENATYCGLPIPKKLVEILATLKNKN